MRTAQLDWCELSDTEGTVLGVEEVERHTEQAEKRRKTFQTRLSP